MIDMCKLYKYKKVDGQVVKKKKDINDLENEE